MEKKIIILLSAKLSIEEVVILLNDYALKGYKVYYNYDTRNPAMSKYDDLDYTQYGYSWSKYFKKEDRIYIK